MIFASSILLISRFLSTSDVFCSVARVGTSVLTAVVLPQCFRRARRDGRRGPEREKVWVDCHLDGLGIGTSAVNCPLVLPCFVACSRCLRHFQESRIGFLPAKNRGGSSAINFGEQIPELHGGFVMENGWTNKLNGDNGEFSSKQCLITGRSWPWDLTTKHC